MLEDKKKELSKKEIQEMSDEELIKLIEELKKELELLKLKNIKKEVKVETK